MDNTSPQRIDQSPTNHALTIPESASEKLFNSIVRISYNLNKAEKVIGTGFFLRVKINNNVSHFLITCQHVIKENFVKEKKVIKLYYGKAKEEKNFEIELDKGKRNIKCFDTPYDVTLVEILKEDKIGEDKYLIPDFSYKNDYNFYLNKNNYFYLAGYPQNNERSISSGKIIKILEESEEFEHSLDAIGGNSGSPICLANNLFVVGIHKQGDGKRPINYGTFLGYILDILEKEENEGDEEKEEKGVDKENEEKEKKIDNVKGKIPDKKNRDEDLNNKILIGNKKQQN